MAVRLLTRFHVPSSSTASPRHRTTRLSHTYRATLPKHAISYAQVSSWQSRRVCTLHCVDFALLVKSVRFGPMPFASINEIWGNEVPKYRSWARSIRRLARFLSGWVRRLIMTLKPSMPCHSLRQIYQHHHLS